MDYLYDVFISYRRHQEWTSWTRDHVYHLLDAYLTQELGRPPQIFIDERIEPGADWPDRLGSALGRARVLLPVFSGDYFSSDWCVHELDLMHTRLLNNPNCRLIVPVIGHDGDLIPIEIARIQPFDLKAFRNTDLQRKTPRYEQLSDAVGRLSPDVAGAIRSAPPFEPSWVEDCRTRFNEVYDSHCSGSALPARTLTQKPTPFPTAPPRVLS